MADGSGATDTATVTVTINGVNDAPAGSPAAVLPDGTEDAAHPVAVADLLAGFSDPDGDTLSIASLVASDGTVADNGDGTYTITPTADFNGTVTLTYNVTDGHGGVLHDQAQSYTLTPVNDTPVAQDDIFTTDEDTAISGNVLSDNGDGADSDVDNDALTVVAIDGGQSAAGDPNILISEIMADPSQVSNSTGEWFEAFNASPVAVDVNGWTIQVGTNDIVIDNGGPLPIGSGQFFVFAANGDPAANGGLVADYATGPLGLANTGTTIAILDDSGTEIDSVAYGPGTPGASINLVRSPDGSDTGLDTYVSTLVYGDGDLGTPGSPAKSNPNGPDATFGVENGAATIGAPVVLTSGALVTLNADGTFDYDPNGQFDSLGVGESTTNSFSYTVADGSGATDTATVTVTINGVNDAPAGSPTAVLSDGPDLTGNSAGNDVLTGSAGPDTFAFAANFGHDTIIDFTPDEDTIEFTSDTFADAASVLNATEDDGLGNTVVTVDADNAVTLQDVLKAQLDTDDFSIA